jgi:membrane dipeptidase
MVSMSLNDRRSFLGLSAAALAATRVTEARVESSKPVSVPDGRWKDALIINALGGLEDPNPHPGEAHPTASNPTPADESDRFTERVLRDAHASGLTAVNVTLGYTAGEMEPFEYTVRRVARADAALRRHGADLLKVYSVADILAAKSADKVGIIFGFQNAAMLGSDATRADLFADLGVRVIQLTYNPANQLGDGSAAPQNRGLTPFGHEAIERLNANRIMVDLSHSGENTCLEAARASRQPVSINHTGCRALNDLPRNKTDAELRLVASGGGFIGIYFMPFLSASGHARAEDVVAHIEHAVAVCGEDHVGIGTDGSVTAIDDLEGYKTALAEEIAARRAAGVSAAGERPDTFPFVVDLRGVNQFHDLADRLQRRGHSSGRIEKILGRNFLSYAREVWGS